MDVKELKIGNYVKYNGSTVSVYAISNPTPNKDKHFDNRERVTLWCNGLIDATTDEIGPIPITNELLEKCGFECNNDMPPYIFDLDKGRRVYMFKNAYGWILQYVRYGVGYDETVSKNIVMFVHQLQNAYYLATGKELEIKL